MKFKSNYKFNKKTFFVIGFILSSIVFTLMIAYRPNEDKTNFIYDDTDEITEKENESKNSEETAISFQTEYLINSQTPDFQLINPKGNTVNMQYTISVNNKTIYKTNLVPPNKAKNVNIKKLLKNGSYKINVYIRTFDIKTNKECNSIPVSGIKIIIE